MARPHYRIHRKALFLWEQLEDTPHLLSDVVDAIEALPADQLEVTRQARPPVHIDEVVGIAFRRRYLVRGVRNANGKWTDIWSVSPLDAGPSG